VIDPVAGGVRLVLTWQGELAGRQEEVFTLQEGGDMGGTPPQGDALSRQLTLTLANGRTWSGTYQYVRA